LDSLAHPSRLHLIYQIIPVAFLIEKAGGKTSDLEGSVLEVPIDGYEQRITFIGGSTNEVDLILKSLGDKRD
jgi:fructose-1,6-bisphosphatase